MKATIPKYSNRVNCVDVIEPTFKDKDKQIIKDFLLFCGGSAGKTTLKKYHRVIIKICDVFEGDLDKIDLERLREFLKILNESDLLPPTKNQIKKILKRFLKEYYEDWSKRFKNFSDRAFKGEDETNQLKINANTILRHQEIELLVRSCQSLKYKALIMLMYETASRPEESLKLKWKDVNLFDGDVKLVSSKTGNLRINPIQETILHLKRYKQEYPHLDVNADDYVFVGAYDRSKHQTLPSFGMYLKRLGLKVLGREIFPYLIRHTRATELQKVLPPKVYEKFMDHSLETATRYSHLDKKDVRDSMFKNVYKVEEISEDKRNSQQKEIDFLKDKITAMGTVQSEFLKQIEKRNEKILKEYMESIPK